MKAFAVPHQELSLRNPIANNDFKMHRVGPTEAKRDIITSYAMHFEPARSHRPTQVLAEFTLETFVTHAVALLGFVVQVLPSRSLKTVKKQAKWLESFRSVGISVSLDGETIVSKAPLADCDPFQGDKFVLNDVVFLALEGARSVGVFMANGTRVKITAHGLPNLKVPYTLTCTLEAATYATRG
jgi:hypothetical protein